MRQDSIGPHFGKHKTNRRVILWLRFDVPLDLAVLWALNAGGARRQPDPSFSINQWQKTDQDAFSDLE